MFLAVLLFLVFHREISAIAYAMSLDELPDTVKSLMLLYLALTVPRWELVAMGAACIAIRSVLRAVGGDRGSGQHHWIGPKGETSAASGSSRNTGGFCSRSGSFCALLYVPYGPCSCAGSFCPEPGAGSRRCFFG